MIKDIANQVKALKKKVLNKKALQKKLGALGLLHGDGVPVD